MKREVHGLLTFTLDDYALFVCHCETPNIHYAELLRRSCGFKWINFPLEIPGKNGYFFPGTFFSVVKAFRTPRQEYFWFLFLSFPFFPTLTCVREKRELFLEIIFSASLSALRYTTALRKRKHFWPAKSNISSFISPSSYFLPAASAQVNVS